MTLSFPHICLTHCDSNNHSDVEKIQDGIGQKLGQFFLYMSTFFTGFIVGFIYGWQLTLVILAVSPLLAISGGIMGKVGLKLQILCVGIIGIYAWEVGKWNGPGFVKCRLWRVGVCWTSGHQIVVLNKWSNYIRIHLWERLNYIVIHNHKIVEQHITLTL